MATGDHRRQGSDASDCELMLVDINNDNLDFSAHERPRSPRRPGLSLLSHVKMRIRCEASLLRKQCRMYIFCIFINIYGGSVVFRNLAFYRFEIGERITQDIGFQLLPEKRGILTTLPMSVLQAFTLLSCAACFFPISKNAPFATNIVRRWGMVEAVGTVLRFLTYTSTTLPGVAQHCLPENTASILRDRPKTARDIMFSIKVDGVGIEKNSGESGTYNCGDLVFSGHMLMTILYALCIIRYSPSALNLSRTAVKYVLTPTTWALVVIQALNIIMARNHYTMDVVIACYLTPLLWHWHGTRESDDMAPF